MNVSPAAIVRLLLPRLPLILSTLILNKFHLSANSDKQDARTEVVVLIIRSLMQTTRPMKVIQDGSLKGPLKGKMWISQTAVPAPDAHLRDAVVGAIKYLGDGSERYDLPDICDVEGEWTGYRDTPDKNAPRLQISEREQYDHLMKEVTSDVVILYLHGGAYFLMDPATHRVPVSQLAKQTGGRAFSVRYRLAPQHPFPAALLDALTAYLYLLAPPPDSFHKPIPASKIVFSGDSAGGNLASALTLLLLTLRRMGTTSLPFHGATVPLDLPGGIALNSPWCDIGRSLPSIWSNAKYDYLDPPTSTGLPARTLAHDSIWPTSPPRAEIFCSATVMTHPLVSPLAATPEMWTGCPPVFICGGNEGLEDEFTAMARRMYLGGASVVFKGYEGMPHCFAMIFPGTPAARDCLASWAGFMVEASKGSVKRSDRGTWMKAKSSPLEFRDVELGTMGVSDEVVERKMVRFKEMAVQREEEGVREWESGVKAKL